MPIPNYLKLLVVSKPMQAAYDFIAAVSTEPPIQMNDKMCLGEMVIPDTPVVKLSGTVGSAQYDETWAIILEDFLGAVILVDGEDAESIRYANQQLAIFAQHRAMIPVIVAVRHFPPEQFEAGMRVLLDGVGQFEGVRLLTYDPQQPDDAKHIIMTLSKQIPDDSP